MAELNVTGSLKVKNNEQVVSEKFRKREFVITDSSSQYPQYISFQLTQDKCPLLDSYNIGDEITVHFNLRGREWKSPQGEIKYFNSLEAWRIERKGNAVVNAPANESYPAPTIEDMPMDVKDDLPF
jgi:Domain of unknown function (DUF3127)